MLLEVPAILSEVPIMLSVVSAEGPITVLRYQRPITHIQNEYFETHQLKPNYSQLRVFMIIKWT